MASGRHRASISFNAFLSHRYKSVDVNLYFWRLMSEVADVQFEVDVGSFSTSTTRLARLIRGTDAFIGIYALPLEAGDSVDRQILFHQSRYFRLELDMAIRARKPAMVFFDQRYVTVFNAPNDVLRCEYNHQETSSSGKSPSSNRLQRTFLGFIELVRASLEQAPPTAEAGRVGLVAAPDLFPAGEVMAMLRDLPAHPVQLSWPPSLDLAFLARLRHCDWVIVEESSPQAQAVLAFLHGQAIPVLRTRFVSADAGRTAAGASIIDVLFGSFEVGYSKDVILWRHAEELIENLRVRAWVIMFEPSRRISDAASASSYFNEAVQRKEAVFLSYAREDADRAGQIAIALRKRFSHVFDYGDRESLPQGRPWLDSLIMELAGAAIGVVVLSESYLVSDYCMEEARLLKDASLSRGLRLYPVKVDDAPVPEILGTIEYFRIRQFTAEEIAARIVADVAANSG